MKKIILSLTIFGLLCTGLFAQQKVWSDRIFEFNAAGSTLVSNNLFGIKEIATDTIVIDFTKMANELKRTGQDLNETLAAEASTGFLLDVPNGLILGGKAGAQLYESISIGKELFYFLGYGNQLNEDINISLEGFADIFIYAQADFGWNFKKCKVVVSPSVYSAIMHMTTEGSKLTTKNTSDGKFAYELDANLSIYTPFGGESDLYDEIMDGNFERLLEVGENAVQNFWSNAGFDIQANVDYYLNKDFSIIGGVKIPVIPSKLSYKSAINVKSSWETSIMDAAQGNVETPSMEVSTTSEANRISYRINRPLKLIVGGDFHPWNNIMNYYGTVGLCFEHPFAQNMSESDFYVDYLLGIHLSVFNAINLNLSTERTDKVFCQKVSGGVNLRLFEINVGLASASTDFACSFKQGGANVFFDVHVGL